MILWYRFPFEKKYRQININNFKWFSIRKIIEKKHNFQKCYLEAYHENDKTKTLIKSDEEIKVTCIVVKRKPFHINKPNKLKNNIHYTQYIERNKHKLCDKCHYFGHIRPHCQNKFKRKGFPAGVPKKFFRKISDIEKFQTTMVYESDDGQFYYRIPLGK